MKYKALQTSMSSDTTYEKLSQAEEGLVGPEEANEDSVQGLEAVEVAPPVIVKTIIEKPTKETLLGIKFSPQPEGWLRIDEVAPGLLADRACPGVFQPGMKLLFINEIDFQHSAAPKERLEYLYSFLQGIQGRLLIVTALHANVGYVSCTRPFEEKFIDEPLPVAKAHALSSWPGLALLSSSSNEIVVRKVLGNSSFLHKLQALDTILMIETSEYVIDCRSEFVTCQVVEDKLGRIPEGETLTIFFARKATAQTFISPKLSTSTSSGNTQERVWGSAIVFGVRTLWTSIACCLIGGLFPAVSICSFPFDRQRAYRGRNGIIYSVNGNAIARSGEQIGFLPGEQTPGVDHDAMAHSLTIATSICFGVFLVVVFLSSAAY